MLGLNNEPMSSACAPDDLLQKWLELCGLDLPDSALPLVGAAIEDFRSHTELRNMLAEPPEVLMHWWHEQSAVDWRMTQLTGNTDWAWLVLARMGKDVSDSRFGGLHPM